MTIARKTIMISSTARDLPEHRKEVMDACLRQGMFPIMMEHLPANDDEAISVSLKMVDDADIYVGVFAQRYGYIPKGKKRNPKQISITEMEYDRAVKRKIPRLIFVMDKSHPITIDDIDIENTVKLKAFKDRIQTKNIVNFFKSSADLRSHVINSLSKYLGPSPITISKKDLPIIDPGAYFNAISRRYGVLALEGLTPPQKEEYLQIRLHSVFVEQSVRENPPPVELPKEVWEKLSHDKEIHQEDLPADMMLEDVLKARDTYYEKPLRPVLEVLTDSRHQYAIILGDPGSGKSTLARYVMLSLIDSLAANDKLQKAFLGYLPLLIELRTFAGLSADGKCETPLEFLEHLGKTEGWGLTQDVLHNYLKNDGRAVVIFDGLDEIFDSEQRERITNQIVGFTSDYPKVRIVVTSRVVGYRRKILTDAGFTHFTLQDLDERQVETFVTRWYDLAMSDRLNEAKERRERILKSFRESSSIRQLAGNPMLLTIMAIIGKHQEMPRERWKLYDHAASVLIQHWDVNKHLKDESIEADFMGEDDKKELLRRLAFRMQGGESGLAGNYIYRDDLQTEFESYLKERYSQTPDRAKIIAEAMIQQFRERNFILSLYGANLYGFVHRAFLEYFCAAAFVWKFEKTKELPIEQFKVEVYGKRWEDQSWHEVLRLICGMIDEKWARELVDFLVSETDSVRQTKSSMKTPWSLALAIQCLGEVRNINSVEKIAQKAVKKVLEIMANRKMARGSNTLSSFFEITLAPSLALIDKTIIKHDISSWIRRIIQNSIPSASYYQACSLVAVSCATSESVLKVQIGSLSKNSKPWLRYFFVETIAKMSWDPEISNTLIEFAKKETDMTVLGSAISALVNNSYEKQEISVLLFDRVSNRMEKNDRAPVIAMLGQHFREDARTLPLLQNYAVNDASENVRSSAVSLLAEYFGEDAQTLPLLQERAVNDASEDVRSSAVRSLAEYFGEDARTLPLLQERAVNDASEDVRSSAVSLLAEYFGEDARTLPLLQDRAVNDASEDVRSSAVRSLAEYFREDAQTLLLLLRTTKDQSPNADDPNDKYYPREVAIEAIANYWPTHKDTLPLLQDCAQNDPTPWLRDRAKELILEIENK